MSQRSNPNPAHADDVILEFDCSLLSCHGDRQDQSVQIGKFKQVISMVMNSACVCVCVLISPKTEQEVMNYLHSHQ